MPNPTGKSDTNKPQSASTETNAALNRLLDRLSAASIDWRWPDESRFGRSTDAAPRRPAAVVYPTSTEDVQLLVRVAGEHAVPLYPISRGCNWGYGDAAPPYAGQVVVDLQHMNRVVEVNQDQGYCVLEPGVTQGQLYQHLQDLGGKLWMDATGAGPNASVVGNTLDRGFGHTRFGDHFQTACGMQVVLPSGDILHTGFGRFANAKAHRAFPYGVGPFVDGLFAQSNLGIVTRLGLWLQPKPQAFGAFFFSAQRDTQLEEIIERLAPLRKAGLLQSAIHLANDLRVVSARTRFPYDRADGRAALPESIRAELRRDYQLGAWNGLGAMTGTKATVKALRSEVRRALRGIKTVFLDDRRLRLANTLGNTLGRLGLAPRFREQLEVVGPAYGLLKGQPSSEHLKGALWRVKGELADDTADPLAANAGLIWVSPVMPMTGGHAREVLDIIEPIYNRFGFDALVTFTMLSERAMVAVTNLAFDLRDAEAADRAHRCYPALCEALASSGYYPYRVGPLGYDKVYDASDPYWQMNASIKQALDPKAIMSPGRYLRSG